MICAWRKKLFYYFCGTAGVVGSAGVFLPAVKR